jgi:hypothetical protein
MPSKTDIAIGVGYRREPATIVLVDDDDENSPDLVPERLATRKVPALRAGWVVVDSIKTQSRHQSVSLCRDILCGGVTMSRKRKPSYQPTSEYNAYLAGWAFAFAVVLVTLRLIAVHFWWVSGFSSVNFDEVGNLHKQG